MQNYGVYTPISIYDDSLVPGVSTARNTRWNFIKVSAVKFFDELIFLIFVKFLLILFK